MDDKNNTGLHELTLSLDCGTLRVTPDGKRVSAFDVITATGDKSARKTWERIGQDYPEVVAQCHDFTFSGQGQRPTPTVDREGFVLLTMVLPGKGGDLFRLKYKDIVIAYLDGRLISKDLPALCLLASQESSRVLSTQGPKALAAQLEKSALGDSQAAFAAVALYDRLREAGLVASSQEKPSTQMSLFNGKGAAS